MVEQYTPAEGLPVNPVASALLEDRDGRIWVGTAYGLYQLVAEPQPHRPVVARLYTTKDGLPAKAITALCQSADGKLWVGTGLEVSQFTPGKSKDGRPFQSYTPANGLSYAKVTALNQSA